MPSTDPDGVLTHCATMTGPIWVAGGAAKPGRAALASAWGDRSGKSQVRMAALGKRQRVASHW